MASPVIHSDAFARLRRRLAGLRRQLRWYYFCNGLNWLITVGAGAAILLGVFAVLLQAPSSILLGLGVVAGLVWLLVLLRYVAYPLTRRISDLDLVVLIERENPWLKDRLISTLQLAQQQERETGEYSPKMAEALAHEVEQVIGDQDFRDVLKPNRLLPMGLTAVAMSLALAGTSFALSVYEPPRFTIVVRVIDEQSRHALDAADAVPHDVVLNFIATRDTGSADVAERLVVARGSDLVIDGIPSLLRRGELNLNDHTPAQILINERDRREMRARGQASDRRPYYRYVLQNIRADQTVRLRWHGAESQAIHIEVTDPPRITDSHTVYRVPPRMRPRQVPKEPGRADSIPVRIQLDEQNHIELTVPRPDTLPLGRALSSVWANDSDTITYATEEEFAAADPQRYALYVRERTETRDVIAGTEDMLVAFRFSTNRPIDPERSYLGIRLRPSAWQARGQETLSVGLTQLDTVGREWEARFRLDQAMTRYFVRLVDERGLHQGALAEYDVNVVPDRAPIARFRDIGVALLEGRNERFATPQGRFPIVVAAEDDFGLRSLMLEFRQRDEPDDAWRPVPGFDAAPLLRQFQRTVEIPFELWISRLLPNLTLGDDGQVELMFRLVAEDVKVDPVHQQGQLAVSPTLELTVISPVRMRAEIRFLIRRVLTQQLQDAKRKQGGLLLATSRFLPRGGDEIKPPATLAGGIPMRDVFFWDERWQDEANKDKMFTGVDALRVQEEVARTAASVARRLDAIVRHYIYNDLEDDRNTPQENRLQEAKVLLALAAAEKEAALDLSATLKQLDEAEDLRQRERAMTRVLDLLLGQRSGLVPVRARFNKEGFAQLLQSVEFRTAGAMREASFQYEQALSSETPQPARFEVLRRALNFQSQSERLLDEVLARISQWEGIDEWVESLRRLRAIEERLRDRTDEIIRE